jgi:hypothetical protein
MNTVLMPRVTWTDLEPGAVWTSLEPVSFDDSPEGRYIGVSHESNQETDYSVVSLKLSAWWPVQHWGL